LPLRAAASRADMEEDELPAAAAPAAPFLWDSGSEGEGVSGALTINASAAARIDSGLDLAMRQKRAAKLSTVTMSEVMAAPLKRSLKRARDESLRGLIRKAQEGEGDAGATHRYNGRIEALKQLRIPDVLVFALAAAGLPLPAGLAPPGADSAEAARAATTLPILNAHAEVAEAMKLLVRYVKKLAHTGQVPPPVGSAKAAGTAGKAAAAVADRGHVHGRGAGRGRGLATYGEPRFDDCAPSWQAKRRVKVRDGKAVTRDLRPPLPATACPKPGREGAAPPADAAADLPIAAVATARLG